MCARQGPLSRTCIRESERARKRRWGGGGQLGGVHEGHGVSHLAQGLRPIPAMSPPGGLSRPTTGGDPGGVMLGGGAVPPAHFTHTPPPPGAGAAVAKITKWDLG